MKRRSLLAGALAAGGAALGAFWPALALARERRRVGMLEFVPRGHERSISTEFVAAMAKLGFAEGKDIEYLHRSPERFEGGYNQRLGVLAEELVRARPDAIVTAGTYPTKAVASVTRTIPIVASLGNPVQAGFARSMSRPGGNVTGVALNSPEIYGKAFDYLRAIIPGNWSLAIAVDDDTHTLQSLILAVEEAARQRSIPMRTVNFQGMDAARADRTLVSLRREGIRVLSPFATVAGVPDDVLYTTKYGFATIPSDEDTVARGGLLGYFSQDDDVNQRMAAQVARILRGTPAGDIPFETPRRVLLLLNRKAAATLGVTIPREILVLADKVYD